MRFYRAVVWTVLAIALAVAVTYLVERDATQGGSERPPKAVGTPKPTASGGRTIRGRIVGTLAEPVQAVRITAHRDTGHWRLADAPRPPLAVTQTDEDGRFELSLPKGQSAIAVQADHPHLGSRTLGRGIAAMRADLGSIEWVAPPGVVIRVVAQDSQRPVRATVSLRPVLVDADTAVDGAPHTSGWQRETDGDGMATFYAVPPGEWLVQATAPRYRTTEHVHRHLRSAPESARPVHIPMARGWAQAGSVLDPSEQPIVGARVTAVGNWQEAPSTTTDSSGHFRLPGLGPDVRELLITAADGATRRFAVIPDAGFLAATWSGAPLQGTVVDGSQRPIGQARVELLTPLWPDVSQGRVAPWETDTDATGTFRFLGISAGRKALEARSKGFGRGSLGPLPGTVASNPTVSLNPAASVVGKVLGPDGQPLANAMVTTQHAQDLRPPAFLRGGAGVAMPRRSAELPTARAGRDGQFRLRNVAPTRQRIVIQAPGLPSWQSQATAFQPGSRHQLGTVRMIRGGTVAGRTLDLAGRPAPGVRVTISPIASKSRAAEPQAGPILVNHTVRSGPDGHFRLTAVAPGAYRMFYDSPETDTARTGAARRAATRVDIQVADHTTSRHDLRPRIR